LQAVKKKKPVSRGTGLLPPGKNRIDTGFTPLPKEPGGKPGVRDPVTA
jgi:hypothetical protein